MSAGQTATESAGDTNRVARLGAMARENARSGGDPEQGETCGQSAVDLGHVATHNGYLVTSGAGGEAAIKLFQPLQAGVGIETEREHGGGGAPTHGRQITEIAFEKLGSDGARRHGGVKMFPVNHRIDRDELTVFARGQHGAIVTHAEGRAG